MTRICVAAALAALALGIVASVGVPGSLARSTKPKVVKVLDDFYKPDSVRIKKRHKVKWKWGADFNSHNVTLKKGPDGVKKSKFTSQTSSDEGFTFTKRFKKTGKYKFYCTIHPDVMRMTVRVHR